MSEYTFEDSLNKALQDPEFRKEWAKSYTSRSIVHSLGHIYCNSGVSYNELVKATKMSKKKLNKVLYGEDSVRIKTLNRVAKVFGMKVKIELVPIDEIQLEINGTM